MTTSIPESAGSIRNWDYRHCWLRDAYFVVNELNRLGATRTMERHLRYILNIIASAKDRPCGRCTVSTVRLPSTNAEVDSLPGYRGMGPVRVGNQAHRQLQHDLQGCHPLQPHILRPSPAASRRDTALFERLETSVSGGRAHDKPDAGIWGCVVSCESTLSRA